jgi:hypothetical protein
MCAAAEVTSFNVLNKSFMIVMSEVISADFPYICNR